ncbi:MAG: hypothetical protein R3A49_01915 [Acidimicrobiia bacterium]
MADDERPPTQEPPERGSDETHAEATARADRATARAERAVARADAVEASEAADARYRRRIGVLLALIAVATALVGAVETRASTNESWYARETTRTGVEAMAANVTRAAAVGVNTDLDASQAALASSSLFSADERAADLAQAEVENLAVQPELDRLTLDAQRLTLKQAAQAETRVTWNNRASQYGTVITTLGVALFLVGFTLVLSRRVRPPILLPGILLTIYCLGWTTWIWQREIPDTPDAAIEATAAGNTAVAAGTYDSALGEFDAAVARDSGYASAFSGRSAAGFLAANPDYLTTGAVTDVDSDVFEQSVDDAGRAVDLSDGRDFLAFYLEALTSFYDGGYDDAVAASEQALAINPQAAQVYFLEAAAELARGNDGAARNSYEAGVDVLDPTEASEANRILIADFTNQLEQARYAVPELADTVDDAIRRIALAEARLSFGSVTGTAPDGATVEVPTLEWDDGELHVAVGYKGLPPDTRVSAYLFERPIEAGAWVQPFEFAVFGELTGEGTLENSLAAPRQCAPTELRLDVYLDGALADSVTRPGVPATC